MLRKTIFVNYYYDNGELWYVDDDAYVVDGYSIRSLLNYLEADDDNVEPWCFSKEACFNVHSRYYVVVDSIMTYYNVPTIKVYNLDRLRHNRKHGY